jgi:probable FeS assembly SUF system protein SufT
MTDQRQLTRDLDATLIPHGQVMTLPAGTTFVITHRLGGNFTIDTPNGMYRVTGDQADALGEEIPAGTAGAPAGDGAAHEGPPSEDAIWEKLKMVFDPEIPVNIVDLGLVYSMNVTEPEAGTFKVEVAMTLTAPGCGMGPAIADDAKQKVLTLPGVSDANVEIVWDPPWTQDMISEEGKMQLGLI